MQTLLSPVREGLRGGGALPRGLSWLKAHPRYLFLLFIPIILSFAVIVSTWGMVWQYRETLLDWILFAKPEAWWGVALYYVARAFLYLVVFIMGLVIFMLGVNVLSSPVYDLVSFAVERDLRGGEAQDISLLGSLKLMGEEAKKALFIACVSIAALLTPGVNFVAPIITAFFLGWGLYDYPLARRSWRFRQRLAFVLRHPWGILGLGLWMLIPGVQMLVMPLSVVGATLLAVEDLTAEEAKKQKSKSSNAT